MQSLIDFCLRVLYLRRASVMQSFIFICLCSHRNPHARREHVSDRIPPHLDTRFSQAVHAVVDQVVCQYGNPQMPIYTSFRLMVDGTRIPREDFMKRKPSSTVLTLPYKCHSS